MARQAWCSEIGSTDASPSRLGTRSQQFDDFLILRVAKTKWTGYLPRHQAGRNAS